MSWMTLLWAGLLAVGLPLLIHRMRRRGTVRLPMSSISLIRSGRDRARRQWSMDRSLLFWIRLTALGSLAIALAMVFPGERTEPLDVSGADVDTQPAFESIPGPSSPSDSTTRMVVALMAEPEVAGPLATAIRLLGETRPMQLDSSAPDHPQLWSRQRRLAGSEDVQEVWLQQGWAMESAGSDEWVAWIRAGGHLVVTLDTETSVVALNRWLSTAGREIRVEPARERAALSTDELNRWLGEELYGRPVDAPRMDLPDLFPERILRGGNSDEVLLRSEGGDPLVWRGSLGEGWITLSTLDWEEG
ncbi:MAG: BatA domain-containing protein, partial [Bacteroidota bacterium]